MSWCSRKVTVEVDSFTLLLPTPFEDKGRKKLNVFPLEKRIRKIYSIITIEKLTHCEQQYDYDCSNLIKEPQKITIRMEVVFFCLS